MKPIYRSGVSRPLPDRVTIGRRGPRRTSNHREPWSVKPLRLCCGDGRFAHFGGSHGSCSGTDVETYGRNDDRDPAERAKDP
jgi:hypothetical protein